MTPTHVIYLPYFGNGTFLPHLKRLYHELVHEVKTRHPVVVLTDNATLVPTQFNCLRVDTSTLLSYVRQPHQSPGWVFDYKAALVLAALGYRMPWRCVVMDVDNFVRGNFDDVVGAVPEDNMAMPPSPGEPYSTALDHPDFAAKDLPEHTSSFMVFGAGDYALLQALRYKDIIHEHNSMERDHVLREQRTWSLVWHHMNAMGKATLLDRRMGWSRFWSPMEPSDTLIRHKHGKEKWGEGGQ